MKKQIIDYPAKTQIDNTDIFLVSSPQGIINTVTGDNIKTLVGNNDWLVITANLNDSLTAGGLYIFNCASGSQIQSLPNNPSIGDSITFIVENITGNNSLTIQRNGKSIQGINQDLIISSNYIRANLTYSLNTWVFNFFESGITGIHSSYNPGNPDNNPNIDSTFRNQYNCLQLAETIAHTLVKKDCTLV